MQLVPVLEVRHGKCVHTEPKNSFVDKVVKEGVLEKVEEWVKQGVKRIHFVDVDAIESGEPENVSLIRKIKNLYPDLAVQVLGGIKSTDSAYVWVDSGADFLVLNGKAMRQRNLLDDMCVEFPGKVLVELDSHQGKVAMGAGEPNFSLASIARQLEEDGVSGLVVNQIKLNGHSLKENLELVMQASKDLELEIFTHGGVNTAEDLEPLLNGGGARPAGVLVGKALYNGFCLKSADALLGKYR